jgi:putative transposase
VNANQAEFPVLAMCRVLGLSPSGYYAWLQRPPSNRAERDAELVVKIHAVFDDNRQVYGRPRIFADLKENGECRRTPQSPVQETPSFAHLTS